MKHGCEYEDTYDHRNGTFRPHRYNPKSKQSDDRRRQSVETVNGATMDGSFSDICVIPVSRWTEMRQAEIEQTDGLQTLLGSDETGPCLVQDEKHRALYIFNHFEYDNGTLKEEYDRDVAAGTPINIPINYYPNDDPSQKPRNQWKSHGHLLYGNWISEIYLTTPYDMDEIGKSTTDLRKERRNGLVHHS